MSTEQENPNIHLLEMEQISKSFPGVKALNDVIFKVRKGTVHSLVGENGAGKSTLMKCLFGIYTKDTGTITFRGKEVNFQSTGDALKNGISMVHQELNQVLTMNVMQNIWLGRFPMKGMIVDEKAMYENSKKIFDELKINVDPRARVDSLSVSHRQLLEIAKAVSYDAQLIVFDEPTSSLTDKEVELLFHIINMLRAKGVSIIYISHKMEEIKRISDDITVMRDGCNVFSGRSDEKTIDQIISLMVGRELTNLYPPKKNKPSNEILFKVERLTGLYEPTIHEASFELRKGEILGIVGLLGSRRTELVETIFGIRKKKSGDIYLNGEVIANKNTMIAIKNGFALLTEERRQTGIFEDLSVQFNSVISHLKDYTNRLGILKSNSIRSDAQRIVKMLHVKTASLGTKISTLSGGNQQKVIFGRWMLNDFQVLMLDEPTRGIDVGAKYEIYELMIDIAAKGKGIIFISSEMPEVLGVADRILVMSNGYVAGILDQVEATQEAIMRRSIKYL